MDNNINPSSREMYVIGIFDCGCEYESSLSSVEIVRCFGQKEVKDTKRMMNLHSSEFQCHLKGAMSLLIFEGKLKTKEGSSVHSYKVYMKSWKSRDKEGKKIHRDYSKFNKLFDRQCKWYERVRIRDKKIQAQEDANTGVGIT